MCNYSSAKHKLLVLKWAVTEKFRDYLLGLQCSHGKIKPYINWPAQITTQGAEEKLAITSAIAGICI